MGNLLFDKKNASEYAYYTILRVKVQAKKPVKWYKPKLGNKTLEKRVK